MTTYLGKTYPSPSSLVKQVPSSLVKINIIKERSFFMGKKTMFKPVVLSMLLGSALFTMLPAQANAAAVSAQQAIDIAEGMSGKYAYSIESKGRGKKGTWEIDVSGPNGMSEEYIIRKSNGKLINVRNESNDYDDRKELQTWYGEVHSGNWLPLGPAIEKAQKTWPGSRVEEASYEAAENRYDNDRWDNDDDRDDRWDNDDDDDDRWDNDDDDDDRWDNDDDDDRYENRKAHYEVELKKGHRERSVEVDVKKKK